MQNSPLLAAFIDLLNNFEFYYFCFSQKKLKPGEIKYDSTMESTLEFKTFTCFNLCSSQWPPGTEMFLCPLLSYKKPGR